MKSLEEIRASVELTVGEKVDIIPFQGADPKGIILHSYYNNWFFFTSNFALEFVIRKHSSNFEKLFNLTILLFDCELLYTTEDFGEFSLELSNEQKLEYSLLYFS